MNKWEITHQEDRVKRIRAGSAVLATVWFAPPAALAAAHKDSRTAEGRHREPGLEEASLQPLYWELMTWSLALFTPLYNCFSRRWAH